MWVGVGILTTVCYSCQTLHGLSERAGMRSPKARVALSRLNPLWTVSPHVSKSQNLLEAGKRIETASPVRDGTSLYVGTSEGFLRQVSTVTGTVTRDFDLGAPLYGNLLITEEFLYLGDMHGRVLKINKTDQTLVWSISLASEVFAKPALDANRLYVTTAHNEVFCLNEADGTILWKQSLRGRSDVLSLIGSSEPIVTGSEVFVGYEDGSLVAYNKNDGRLVWTKVLSRAFGDTIWDLDSLLLEDKSNGSAPALFAMATQGGLYRIDPRTKTIAWKREVESSVPIIFGPRNESLFISGKDGFVHRLASENGETLYKVPIEEGVPGPLVVLESTVATLVYSKLNRLVLFDLESGQLIESHPVPLSGYGRLVSLDGERRGFAFASAEGFLAAFHVQ